MRRGEACKPSSMWPIELTSLPSPPSLGFPRATQARQPILVWRGATALVDMHATTLTWNCRSPDEENTASSQPMLSPESAATPLGKVPAIGLVMRQKGG